MTNRETKYSLDKETYVSLQSKKKKNLKASLTSKDNPEQEVWWLILGVNITELRNT